MPDMQGQSATASCAKWVSTKKTWACRNSSSAVLLNSVSASAASSVSGGSVLPTSLLSLAFTVIDAGDIPIGSRWYGGAKVWKGTTTTAVKDQWWVRPTLRGRIHSAERLRIFGMHLTLMGTRLMKTSGTYDPTPNKGVGRWITYTQEIMVAGTCVKDLTHISGGMKNWEETSSIMSLIKIRHTTISRVLMITI